MRALRRLATKSRTYIERAIETSKVPLLFQLPLTIVDEKESIWKLYAEELG